MSQSRPRAAGGAPSRSKGRGGREKQTNIAAVSLDGVGQSVERDTPPRWWLGGLGAIVLCGLLAYGNSLRGPLVFDDRLTVLENLSIRTLWSTEVFRPERELPVAGRPLVNLTFAANYAMHEADVRGYHAVNLLVHLCNALLVAGIVRRTTRLRYGDTEAALLAGMVAAIWVVHPLASEAVSYITQRTESMAGAAFLATLYAAIRAASSDSSLWKVTAVVASAAGMACKESMVVVPLVVVAFDRVFLYSSWRDTLGRRWPLYLGLAGTWLVLAGLLSSGGRMYSAGFGAGVGSWTYLLNQALLIPRYIRLAVWPSALVLNYGEPVATGFEAVWVPVLILGGLVLISTVSVWKGSRLGFLGWSVFALLAPTSSLLPIVTEVGAERRMYLPLVAIVAAACAAGAWVAGALRGRHEPEPEVPVPAVPDLRRWALVLSAAVLVVGAGTITTRARNVEYQSALTLAETTLARWPTPVARHMVATELAALGRHDEAIAAMQQSVKGYPRGYYDLGVELFNRQDYDGATAAFETFIAAEPLLLQVPDAHALAGRAHTSQQRLDRAISHLETALGMRPGRVEWRGLLADALFKAGQYDKAAAQYDVFVAAFPRDGSALANLGIARAAGGALDRALQAFRRAVEVDPANQSARRNLANVLLDLRQFPEALQQAQEAVRLDPSDAVALDMQGLALVGSGRIAEAMAAFDRAAALAPADPDIRAHAAAVRGQRPGGTARPPAR